MEIISNPIDKKKLLDRYSRNTPGKWKEVGYSMLPHALLQDHRISKTSLVVYWVLRMHIFKGKKSCNPSLEKIAEETHCVKGTALRAIRELERLGYLHVERDKEKKRRTNSYTLLDRVQQQSDIKK